MSVNKSTRTISLVVISSVASFVFAGCSKNSEKFVLGEEFIDSQTTLNVIDTFSVNLSTVILDKMTTTGTGNLLIGSYRDNTFGRVVSNSYFQIGVPTVLDVDDEDRYDSLVLFFRYNKYYFGDTTRSQKISVHQLTQNIQLNDDNVITSETVFHYSASPIGSLVYFPKPNNELDTLFIRISGAIGLDLFAKLKTGSEVLNDDESFGNYFHGMVLVANPAYGGSIVGFYASAENVKLILHTSRVAGTTENITHEFALTNTSLQYNNITHDFSSTPLHSLVRQRNALPSSQTGGVSFLQGGVGLAVRVDFPSLSDLLLLMRRSFITKVELTLPPLQNSYSVFGLPSDLSIYESDKVNAKKGLASNYVSTLTIDELYQEGTKYSFDITDYLKNEISDFHIDPEKGLLVTLPDDVLNTTFARSVFDARSRKARLKISYLTY